MTEADLKQAPNSKIRHLPPYALEKFLVQFAGHFCFLLAIQAPAGGTRVNPENAVRLTSAT